MHTVPPVGYFVVAFVDRSQSKNGSKKWSFRTALSQEDILCYHLGDNHDRMHEVQELVATTPGVVVCILSASCLLPWQHVCQQ